MVTALSIISFVLHKHSKRIAPLLVSVMGTTATVYFMKILFGLARPEHAFYLEDTFTFPSGHSAIAVAL
jgi:undecaprenyl-diphosphatase